MNKVKIPCRYRRVILSPYYIAVWVYLLIVETIQHTTMRYHFKSQSILVLGFPNNNMYRYPWYWHW